jgi:hypothetical protein
MSPRRVSDDLACRRPKVKKIVAASVATMAVGGLRRWSCPISERP